MSATNSTSSNSTLFGLPLPSLNFGNNIIDVSSLTTLIGSTVGESLILGDRGAAGIAWASTSSFGTLWIIAACVNGASPGWLKEMIGIRTAVSDASLGMTLRCNSTHSQTVRKKMPQAIAIICDNKPATEKDVLDDSINTIREVYAFDRATAGKVRVVPETGAEPFRIYAYADYTCFRVHDTRFHVIVMALSLLKLSETVVLLLCNAPLLAVISTLPWLYFFIVAMIIEIHEIRLKRIPLSREGEMDIIAGTLPIVTHPGGPKKIVLGLARTVGQTFWWSLFWGVGAVLCTICLLMTYFIMGQQNQGVSFVWICFQTLWMLARMGSHHFGDFEDPHKHRMLAEKVGDVGGPKLWKHRVLRLTASVARYQTLLHPRGEMAYKNDCYSIKQLCILYQQPILDSFPLSPTQEAATAISTIELNIVRIVGDPILSSAAWIVGTKLTPMDVYDCCIVTFSITADNGDGAAQPRVFSVPASRVYSYMAPKPDSEENISLRQYVPKGTPNTGNRMFWWYFIPAIGNKWLVIRRAAELGLEKAEGRMMSNAQLAEQLLSSQLDVDIKDVRDIRKIVDLSQLVCRSYLSQLVDQ
ncbi:hypothetical protein Clacol_008624 [Clathrus columnatus]|uniref:Uncharacterized protein n=1 Tax=Clathrus columnatus TaxID=1419009 RepID=A0AAV5ANF0_9AGAM|nr:hypothetical protein Clacol_008624 [Clathrus columnatus]